MKRSFTLGLLGLMFFVVSCKREDSVNIDQNRIYTTYELQYDAGKNQTLADATFRIDHNGGSKI